MGVDDDVINFAEGDVQIPCDLYAAVACVISQENGDLHLFRKGAVGSLYDLGVGLAPFLGLATGASFGRRAGGYPTVTALGAGVFVALVP